MFHFGIKEVRQMLHSATAGLCPLPAARTASPDHIFWFLFAGVSNNMSIYASRSLHPGKKQRNENHAYFHKIWGKKDHPVIELSREGHLQTGHHDLPLCKFTVRHLGTSLTADHLITASDVAYRLRLRSKPTPAHRTSLSTQHIRPSGVFEFRSLVQRSGTRFLTSSEIWRVVLTVLNSFLRQSSSVTTNATSAVEVFLNDMRYMNPRFTYLLT